MKKILTILLIATTISATGFNVKAAEEVSAKPGITPNSPFYFLDGIGEKIGMFLAFSPEAKAKKALVYAEEKLAETEVMAEEGNQSGTGQASGKYEKYMEMVQNETEVAKEKQPGSGISEKVAESTAKHFAVLDRVLEKAPEQAKEAILNAKEKSRNGYERVMELLTENNPDKAIAINGNLLKERLEKAKIAIKEEKAESFDSAIDDYKNLQGIFEKMKDNKEELRAKIEEKKAEQIKDLYDLELDSEKISEVAKEKVSEMKEMFQEKIENSLDKLSEVNPEKATEINLEIGKERVRFIKERVENGEEGRMEKYINEAETRTTLGDNISEKMQNKENVSEEFKRTIKNKMTDKDNLLKEIRSKISEEKKSKIEKLIDVSAEKDKKALNAIEGKIMKAEVKNQIKIETIPSF